MKTVKLSDYSKFPKGKENGEDFARSKIFHELYKTEYTLRIDFDGTYGIANSFLEGFFGFLIDSGCLTAKELFNRLTIKADEYPCMIEAIPRTLVKYDERNSDNSTCC